MKVGHPVIPTGMLLAPASMVLLAQVSARSSYVVGVLPGLVAFVLRDAPCLGVLLRAGLRHPVMPRAQRKPS
jgi:hypothetical protein